MGARTSGLRTDFLYGLGQTFLSRVCFRAGAGKVVKRVGQTHPQWNAIESNPTTDEWDPFGHLFLPYWFQIHRFLSPEGTISSSCLTSCITKAMELHPFTPVLSPTEKMRYLLFLLELLSLRLIAITRNWSIYTYCLWLLYYWTPEQSPLMRSVLPCVA